ncbi:MAG: hypothetical protein U0165_19130 [Polyangiaceae bacterium]
MALLPFLLAGILPLTLLGAPTAPPTDPPATPSASPGQASPAQTKPGATGPKVAPLRLPEPPTFEVKVIESSPPGARVTDTLRLDPFEPWGLAGVGAGRRFTDPSSFALLASLRLGVPLNLYGHGRIGFGVVPTGSVETIGSFPDHASAGVALGILEHRRDHYTPSSALVFIPEALFPFRHTNQAKTGGKFSLLFMPRGPFFAMTYEYVPNAGPTIHAFTLSLGVNLVAAAM